MPKDLDDPSDDEHPMTTTDLPPDAPPDLPHESAMVDADGAEAGLEGLNGTDRGAVDPRMRERWIEARRTEGRRRLWILGCVSAVIALVGIGYVVARSPLLGAETVTVRGANAIPAAAVRSAANVGDGAPLLFLDTVAVARRVEALPAVNHAIVTTELPTTVIITVEERRPVAVVRGTGVAPIAVVDHQGRVIARIPTASPGLPELVGVGPAPALGRRLAVPGAPRGLAAMNPQLRGAITRLIVRNGVATVRIAQGSEPVTLIRFGRLENIRHKSDVALAVLDDLTRRSQRARLLDVSVPSAPVTR